ncbi:MAG: hypothetical protein R2827_08740 [Bdellovibrionales bacterium]
MKFNLLCCASLFLFWSVMAAAGEPGVVIKHTTIWPEPGWDTIQVKRAKDLGQKVPEGLAATT